MQVPILAVLRGLKLNATYYTSILSSDYMKQNQYITN